MNKEYYEIKDDLYDVVDRLQSVDNKYFVVRNFVKHRYEVHYRRAKDTLELVVPYKELDSRTIDLVLKTRIENQKRLLEEMENQNAKLQQEQIKNIKNSIMEAL